VVTKLRKLAEIRMVVRAEIVKTKLQYKRKIKSKFRESDPRSLWNGMELMTGLHKGTSTVSLNGVDSDEQLAN